MTRSSPTEPGLDDPAAIQVDDQEKPGRELAGWSGRFVAIVAFAVAVLTV